MRPCRVGPPGRFRIPELSAQLQISLLDGLFLAPELIELRQIAVFVQMPVNHSGFHLL
jgi:hypothetical protein